MFAKCQTSQFLLESGKVVVGNIIQEDENAIYVAVNLRTPQDLTIIEKAEIEDQQVSKQSAMPQGLLNILSKEEVVDLLQFLEAGPAPITQPKSPSASK